MGWADHLIKKLQEGATVKFRPKGNSMAGRVENGALVTVAPLGDHVVQEDDVVLCKVKGNQYLHIVKATEIEKDGEVVLYRRYQIGNNKGRINGWIGHAQIYGVLTAVE